MKDTKMYYLTNTKEAHIKELTKSGAVEAVRDGFVIRPIAEGKALATKKVPMNYTGDGKNRLLYSAVGCDDTAIAVINVRGSHPCGYIKISEEKYQEIMESHEGEVETYEWELPVHGGVTYASYGVPCSDFKGILPEGFWLGWDYAHAGDFTCCGVPELDYFHDDSEKRWTTTEVVHAAKIAIKAIRNGDVILV